MAVICGTPAPLTTRVVQMEPGPMPTLIPSAPKIDQIARAFERRDVAGNQVHIRKGVFDGAHRFHHALAVPVRRIHHQHVHFSGHQLLGALQEVGARTNGRAHAQSSLRIFRRVGIFQLFLNVLDGDQALERVLIVHHQKFLHAVMMQNLLGFFERGAHRNRDEILLGHHVGDWEIVARFESQVAIGQDADQPAVLGDRHAGDAIAFHQRERVENLEFGLDRDGVDNHSAFTALYAIHFLGLTLHRHVAMHDADAALLRQRDGKVRLGDRVHGRADDRDVDCDMPGQAGARIGFGRQDVAAGRLEKYIVEGETFQNRFLDHEGVLPLLREPIR